MATTSTTLQRSLGLAVPLLQSPMAGVQGSALAIAVCEAGGLGAMPCALIDLDTARREIAAIRAATARPFNLNFFCHHAPDQDPARDEAWRAALAPFARELGIADTAPAAGPGRRAFDADGAALVESARPAVVSFHFGLPPPALLARVKATGATVLASATTVDEALWLEANGADAVIAQGLEAGGHRGHFLDPDLSRQSGLFALLPQVVAAVGLPVVAAGGIASAAGVRAALALGAVAVQVGSAYLLADEATTGPLHRAAIAGAGSARAAGLDPRHTALTRLFTGRPARGIVNRLMREASDAAAPAFPLAVAALAPLRAAAEARGSSDFSPLWCGQNAAGCRAAPAAEITRGLFA